MENSRERSFSCSCSHDSLNPLQEAAVPMEAQKLLKSRVVRARPRGPQHSENDCMCGWYRHNLGFL